MKCNGVVTIECVTDADAFFRLEADWDDLARSMDDYTPFMNHGWFDAAWAWRNDGDCSLNILLARNEDRLIGICPLILSSAAYRSFKYRKLEFLTVPDTQFSGILFRNECEISVTSAFAAWISRHVRLWTILDLGYLRTDTASTNNLMAALLKHGIVAQSTSHGENPYIETSGQWEDFYRGRSRRLKKGNNLVANKLNKAGDIRIEWIRNSANDQESPDDLVDTLIEISGSSWKSATGFSLDNRGPGKFIEALTRSARRRNSLSVWVLYINEQPAAMEYQLIENNRVFALRSDFKKEYEHLSPGTYLNWKLLESLFSSGMSAYYMGPGDNPYKRRWTDSLIPMARINGYSNTFGGNLARLLFMHIIPLVKKLLPSRADA